ncbi:MAG: DUF357 domain-containing protein [Thermoprotei archaeon]
MAARYISNVEGALKTLEYNTRIYTAVKNYLADAKHYYAQGDYAVSVVCASYAEGLLDGSFLLGEGEVRNWEWTSKKVVVVGTFDIIHPGHINFLWEAKKYGRVYVIIARDVNVVKAKGRLPIVPEEQRLKVVESLKPVDFAVLGDENDFLKPIEAIGPDIILLGPDEQYPVDKLRRELQERGIKAEVIKFPHRFTEYSLSSTSDIIKRVLDVAGSNRE